VDRSNDQPVEREKSREQLQAEVDALRTRIAQLEHAESEVFASAQHDLRGPLRTINSFAQKLTTLVGTGLFDFGDRDGSPDGRSGAQLQHPQGITYLNGTLYVADTYNHKIRAVDPTSGFVTTVASRYPCLRTAGM